MHYDPVLELIRAALCHTARSKYNQKSEEATGVHMRPSLHLSQLYRQSTGLGDQILLNGNVLACLLSISRLLDSSEWRLCA
jgi:hypothetical protein